jgi:hypothetical protein
VLFDYLASVGQSSVQSAEESVLEKIRLKLESLVSHTLARRMAKKEKKRHSHVCRVGIMYNHFKGGYPVKCKTCGIVGYGTASNAAAIARDHLKFTNW